MNFIPLHINSVYTFLGSTLTIDDLIQIAKKNNLSSIALTDYNSLIASYLFFNKAKNEKIKPIIGIDLKINDILLTFLIKNEIGYQNLLFIFELFNNVKKKNKIEDYYAHDDGLIVIISSNESKLIDKFINNTNECTECLKKISTVFKNFYIGLEIYDNNENIKNEIKKFKNFFKNYNFVAFPFIRYEKEKDVNIYNIVQAIKNNEKLKIKKQKEIGKYYFYNENEIKNLYDETDINNTKIIADSINFNFLQKQKKSINFINNSFERLKKITYEMLKTKIDDLDNKNSEKYFKRLDYELNIINNMNYNDYFLIVMDYVNFAKKNNIYVGPGRGSCCGSLVAYALNITTIDPIKANLLFERFLNQERQNMPDIDVDFDDTERNKIIDYLKQKYGKKHVANIVTVQFIKAKQAIRDIGRIYNIDNNYINELCFKIGNHNSLKEIYENDIFFKKFINNDQYYLFIIKQAIKIENFPKQLGIHASGIIIDNDELLHQIPIYQDSYDNYISGFEKNTLEKIGYLKMDILGLHNLKIMKEIIFKINDENLNYEKIPYDDKKVIKFISNGETFGLFQIDSIILTRIIKIFKPICFEDMVLLIALYRPGSKNFITQIVNNKKNNIINNMMPVEINNILKSTYGIIIYQEQMIKIISLIMNITFSEADIFRRELINKNNNLINLKKDFIDKAIKNNYSKNESEKIFNFINHFSNFNFNRSHAYAYAKLTCQIAYLKFYYPTFFYCVLLNEGINKNEIFSECQKYEIIFQIPNINESTNIYELIDNKTILMPLTAINGLSKQIITNILFERQKGGKYQNFINFIMRTIKYKITFENIMKLINSGCFDKINNNKREKLRKSLNNILAFAKINENENFINNELIPSPYIEENISDDEINNFIYEYQSLNIVITKQLLLYFIQLKKEEIAVSVSEIIKNKKKCRIIGFVDEIYNVKKTNILLFIKIHDGFKCVDAIMFKKNKNEIKKNITINKNEIIIIEGKYDDNYKKIIFTDFEKLIAT